MSYPIINYRGADWSLVEHWLEQELMDTYRKLANPETDAAETERLRGRAQFINLLLDLKNQKPQDFLPL